MRIIKTPSTMIDVFFAALFILMGGLLVIGAFVVGDFLGYKMYVGGATSFGAAALIIGDL